MKLSIPKHIQITEVDGQWVLLDCRENRFYAVGETGAKFLKQIQLYEDMEKGIEHLSQFYQIPCERVQRDISSFVIRLSEKGLLIKT